MDEQFTRRRFTDRKDGRRLRTVSPIFQLSPFTMMDSADALCSFTDTADMSAIEAWLRGRRREGDETTSLFDVIVAAYVRTLSQHPAMNRFVSGRFIYARSSIDIVLSAGESMSFTVRFLPTDTVFDVCRKIGAQAENLKADQSADRLERLAATLVKTPRFVLRSAVGVMKWLDYHGWLGRGLTEKSPFHGSAVISNESSVNLPPVQRSLNRLGNLPVSLSVGRLRTETVIDREQQGLVDRRYMDYAVSYDSRIADSAYIGSAFRCFRQLLDHPEILQSPPDQVNTDTM